MTEWSEDKNFWNAMEPALCAPARLALAEGDVTAMLSHSRIRPNARVLDMGCGPGAHAIAFARRGYRVVGVDTSRQLLNQARSAARNAEVQVEWVEADMRSFVRPESFDLVCSLYTSFGYFDDAQNKTILENIHASLAPGGVFLLDVLGREAAARHFQERRWQEIDGVLYLERTKSADDWSALISEWIVVKDGIRTDFTVRQRLYSSTELRALLLSLGFANVTLAGSLDGKSPYNEAARRLVALAQMQE